VLGCGLLGIYAWTTGRSGDRLDGVGGPNMDDANALAMYLATGTLCAIAMALSKGGWRRYVSLASLVFILNGFVLANTRGAFLGLVVATLVFTFCIARRHRRLYWALTLVGVAGLTLLVDQTFIDRMFTIGDVTSQSESADPSARSRVVIAEAQLQMFLDHPMGIGYRGTAALSAEYMDERWLTYAADGSLARSSHNTFLTALTEQGFIGAVIYGSLLAWTVAAIFRSRRLSLADRDPELATLMAAVVGSIVVVLVSGTSADNLTKEVQFWLYALLMSGFWLANREEAARPPLAAPSSPGLLPVAAPRTH
jgi:O-antigen ligase